MPTGRVPKGFEAPPCSGGSPEDEAIVPVQPIAPPCEGDAEKIRRETPEEALARLVKEMKEQGRWTSSTSGS
jgi:hypothetical protein